MEMDPACLSSDIAKMAIEFEKKYRLTEQLYGSLVARLRAIGAKFLGEEEEENTIFDIGNLTGRPGILRLRSVGGRTLLTLKRRIKSDSSVKQQLEFETSVGDGEEAAAIIAELGLIPAVIYEKRRQKWILPGAEVVLDTLPYGLFMEIEGTIKTISEIEKILDAENIPTEARTYPNMTARYGERLGDVFVSRFDRKENH